MRAFSQLLDALVYTRSRNAKLKLIADYLRRTPDPDRGWAMAALTGDLDLPAVKPAVIRAIVEERVDPVLFRMSRDYVGDTAETVALLWPKPGRQPAELDDGRLRHRERGRAAAAPRPLRRAGGAGGDARPARRERPLRPAQAGDRRAAHRRLGAARQDRARAGVRARRRCGRGGVARPRAALSAAVRLGRGARRRSRPRADVPVFRPFMLAHPLEELRVTLDDYAAEWKWDGIRVQIVHAGGETRLYSRAGDDITGSFPEVARRSTARACSTASCW